MTIKTLGSRTYAREMPDGRIIIATADLYYIEGNAQPTFSLTGEEWRSQRDLTRHRNNRDYEGGLLGLGVMNALILETFPELATFARLHLAGEDGEPMHAVENGWYAYSGDSHAYERRSSYHRNPTDTPHGRAARTLRITEEELPEDIPDKEAFAAFVETLRPRWAEEAAEGKRLLGITDTKEETDADR